MKKKIVSIIATLSWPALICSAEPIITEFLASNDTIIVPGASTQLLTDWIEIHNPDSVAVDLTGWHLTDDANETGKWNFPSGTNLAPGAYLVVFADNTNQADAQGFLHTNFRLSAGGEFLALTRPNESIVSSFGPNGTNYPSQNTDISYGLNPLNQTAVFFNTPTPGSENNTSGIVPTSETQFSVDHGVYSSPITLGITSETSNATIYVTTDSEPPIDILTGNPTPTASIYNSPITISTTTVVRAAAIAPGLTPTDIKTRTYIFPDSVATQTRPNGYPTSWGLEPNADYEIDTRISQSSTYSARFRQGLRELPTLSISGEVADIFGNNGIYSDTQNRNLEVPASAEYFQPGSIDGQNEGDSFQVDCGLRLQGGGSRNPERAIKHSMSLRFRASLGPGRLDFPIFEGISNGEAETSFNSLQLRSIFQNSWVHGDSRQRTRATYIQDQWMRDSFIAMGNQDGGFGDFVNVYINGLYWGVYNLHERADDDHYADYNGFDSDEITGYNPRTRSGPDFQDFQSLRNIINNGTWEEITTAFDIDNYIDYLIMHQFGDNDDLSPFTNYRLAGGGSANAIWKIYLWDVERTLEDPISTQLGNTEDGVGFFDRLDDHPEFRRRFADRAYKHLFNEGALTNTRNRERFLRYVDILNVPIIGESARWGDDRRNAPYTRDDDWRGAVFGPLNTQQNIQPANGVLGSLFPTSGTTRTDTIIAAWRTRPWASISSETWFPSHDPPQFSLDSGSIVLPGNELTLIGGSGTVFYTTDGSDPADNGIVYNGGPIPLASSGVVKTRALSGGQFSALNESPFIVEELASSANLVISEIHYNPDGSNDTAFIEVQNISQEPINLLGSAFTIGIEYTFASPRTLNPGEYLVLAEDSIAFEELYGFEPEDNYSGGLSGGGETVTLNSSSGDIIMSVTYDDRLPWPVRADGDGSSLEFVDLPIYRASARFGGTPGTGPVSAPGIVINEILAHTDPPLSDTIELYNTSNSTVDLSGWFLSDDTEQYRSFRIPDGTFISSGGFLVFDESDFNTPETNPIVSYSGISAESPTTVTVSTPLPPVGSVVTISGYAGIGAYNGTHEITITGPNTFTIPTPFLDNVTGRGTWTSGSPFALSSTQGETLTLSTPDVESFSDSVDFGATFNSESLARFPNIIESILVPSSLRTFSLDNSAAPRIGPIIISEVHYDSLDPFIEIHNTSANTQSLDNWTIRGNADFDFPQGSFLAAGETAIIAATPSAFNSLPAGVQVFGPWEDGDTLLGTSGGVVRLQRPDTVSPDDPNFFPQVVEDEVVFLTSSPWPVSAGQSLQRTNSIAPGSNPNSWEISLPTPGEFTENTFANFVALNSLNGSPDLDSDNDGIPDIGEFALGLNPNSFDSPILEITSVGTPPVFNIDPSAVGVSTNLEASFDLITWNIDPNTVADRLFYRLAFTLEDSP